MMSYRLQGIKQTDTQGTNDPSKTKGNLALSETEKNLSHMV